MSLEKRDDGYRSFSYLKAGTDYQPFDLCSERERVRAYRVPLSEPEEARVRDLVRTHPLVSMHEHAGAFPARTEETPEYVRHGRMWTAFEGLAASYWDCVFDNLMDGICTIHC